MPKILKMGCKKTPNIFVIIAIILSLKLSAANCTGDRGSSAGLNSGAANMYRGSVRYFDQFAMISSRFMYAVKKASPKNSATVMPENTHILEIGLCFHFGGNTDP